MIMPKRIARIITPEVADQCRQIVYVIAAKYDIPPVYITSHMRSMAADQARREVMQQLLSQVHLARWQVAAMLGRDLRRVRKSVLHV